MSKFEEEFLESYLSFGLGSMPKSDIDALVMHLIDKYACGDNIALANYSNQAVSELLRTPVSKIKRLRYEAALKFGGRVEDQAKGRLLAALSNATIEADGNKVCLVLEDSLAKNWIQGQLKNNQLIFDHSFNTEIIKLSASGLFSVLSEFFDAEELDTFRSGYETVRKSSNSEAARTKFKAIAQKFAEGAAKKSGGAITTIFKAQLGTA